MVLTDWRPRSSTYIDKSLKNVHVNKQSPLFNVYTNESVLLVYTIVYVDVMSPDYIISW